MRYNKQGCAIASPEKRERRRLVKALGRRQAIKWIKMARRARITVESA
jgi:hypothetical protein